MHASPSQSAPPPPPLLAPPPPPLTGRKIVTIDKKVDFEFLESVHFEIGRKIRSLGWELLCTLDVPTYPNLVREFYINAKRSDDNIMSKVNGVRIHLNVT